MQELNAKLLSKKTIPPPTQTRKFVPFDIYDLLFQVIAKLPCKSMAILANYLKSFTAVENHYSQDSSPAVDLTPQLFTCFMNMDI